MESVSGPPVRTSFAGRMKRIPSSIEETRPSGICSGPGDTRPQHNLSLKFLYCQFDRICEGFHPFLHIFVPDLISTSPHCTSSSSTVSTTLTNRVELALQLPWLVVTMVATNHATYSHKASKALLFEAIGFDTNYHTCNF